MYDLILQGGRVIDGSGAPWFIADVAISDGLISAVGKLDEAPTTECIDVSGRYVTPGFIDIHTHSDLTLVVAGEAASSVAQGITTQIAGNCGVSAAPTRDHELYYGPLDPAMTRGMECDWLTFAEYFQRLQDQGLGTNVASLVGHGNIRVAAMGYDDRAPSAAEMENMRQLTAQAMQDGALGMSTGLAYAPGPFAKLSEIVELGRVVGDYGGIYTSHIRNQTESIHDAVDEVIAVGEQTGIPAHVSHMQPGSPKIGATSELLATMDAARSRGVDVSCDAIPYTIGSTTLKSLLPPWSLDGGDEALLQRLRDPQMREKIKQDTMTHGAESGGSRKRNLVKDGDWHLIWLGSAERNAQLVGKSFVEIGQARDQDPHDAVLDILIEEEAQPWMLAEDVSEEDFLNIARHTIGGVISDGFSLVPEGVLAEGKHHPRSYGAFPYFLRHFVREQQTLTWEQAIHKLTGHAAMRFRLPGRGLVREGLWADLLVFDSDTIAEAADFNEPYRYPVGIDHVFVNGLAAVRDGQLQNLRAGRVLRAA
ncbi:MAG: D-aminoacylase [Candidatus Latescibacterota bacterium]|nr:D-aminoacylase [Candidatus Latescibacterota bacterium]